MRVECIRDTFCIEFIVNAREMAASSPRLVAFGRAQNSTSAPQQHLFAAWPPRKSIAMIRILMLFWKVFVVRVQLFTITKGLDRRSNADEFCRCVLVTALILSGVLEEFATPNEPLDTSKNTPDSHVKGGDSAFASDFPNNMEQLMAGIKSDDPELLKNIEKYFEAFSVSAKESEIPKHVSDSQNAMFDQIAAEMCNFESNSTSFPTINSTPPPLPQAPPLPVADFQDTLAQTMERLKSSSENIEVRHVQHSLLL